MTREADSGDSSFNDDDNISITNDKTTKAVGGEWADTATVTSDDEFRTEERGSTIQTTRHFFFLTAKGERLLAAAPGNRFENTGTVDKTEGPSASLASTGLRVAIVDDDEDIVSSLALTVKTMGHMVDFEGHDGSEIVEAVVRRRVPLDVIVMDYRMPKMNGLEAARVIREFAPSVKIIIMSADSWVAEESRAFFADPGLAFLEKPFPIGELREHLRAQAHHCNNIQQ